MFESLSHGPLPVARPGNVGQRDKPAAHRQASTRTSARPTATPWSTSTPGSEQGRSGQRRLPRGGERLHRGGDRAPGRAARDPVQRDQGAAPRRPTCRCPAARAATGTTPARSRASSTASTAGVAGRDRRDRPADDRRRRAAAGEEVLLDGNELAGDRSSSPSAPSTSARTAAGWPTPPTSTATSGSPCGSRTCAPARRWPTRCPRRVLRLAWSADGSTLFYITVDDAWRPYRVWRHARRSPAAEDVLVYEEPDERFWVGVELTRCEKFLLIDVQQQDHQ